jgi:hypothetical protein
MATKTSTAQHVFRQRSSTVLAAVCGVIGLLLLLSLARSWAGYPRPLFAAWVVFGLALAWSIFVRPVVLMEVGGVTLRNVVRDVHIPYTRLTDVTCRWNLRVFAGAKGYTAWALSSEVERPKRPSGGMFGVPVPGRLRGVVSADTRSSTAVPKVTAQSVARMISKAKRDYDEADARGEPPPASDALVQVTWVPIAIAVLLLPAIVVLALTLG